MADLVACLCSYKSDKKAMLVADAGDGKGYLSTNLALEHKLKVLGIDFNPVNTLGALIRQEKLEVNTLHTSIKSSSKFFGKP